MDHLGRCELCSGSGAGNVPELHCQQARGSWTQVASALLPKYNTAPPRMAFQYKTVCEP